MKHMFRPLAYLVVVCTSACSAPFTTLSNETIPDAATETQAEDTPDVSRPVLQALGDAARADSEVDGEYNDRANQAQREASAGDETYDSGMGDRFDGNDGSEDSQLAPVCLSGSTQCVQTSYGADTRTCVAGQWLADVPCPTGQVCSAGTGGNGVCHQ